MSKNKKIKTEEVDNNESDYESDDGVKLSSEDECLGAILDTIPALKKEIKLLRKSVKELKKENRKLKSKNTRFTKKSDKQEEKIKQLKDDFKEMKKDYKKSLNEELKATNKCERLNNKIKTLNESLKSSKKLYKKQLTDHNKMVRDTRRIMDKLNDNHTNLISKLGEKLDTVEYVNKVLADSQTKSPGPKKKNKKSKNTTYRLFKAYDDGSHTGPWNYEEGFESYDEVMERAEELKDSYDNSSRHCQVLMIFDDSNEDGDDIWQWNYDPDDESDSEGENMHTVVLDGSALWNSGKVVYSAD